MSAPIPQAPDPLPPVNPGAIVPVVPKTASQQTRSAYYTLFAGIGSAVSAGAETLVQFAPDVERFVPAKWIHAFSGIVLAASMFLLASQRFQAARHAVGVNYTPPPGDGGGV